MSYLENQPYGEVVAFTGKRLVGTTTLAGDFRRHIGSLGWGVSTSLLQPKVGDSQLLQKVLRSMDNVAVTIIDNLQDIDTYAQLSEQVGDRFLAFTIHSSDITRQSRLETMHAQLSANELTSRRLLGRASIEDVDFGNLYLQDIMMAPPLVLMNDDPQLASQSVRNARDILRERARQRV